MALCLILYYRLDRDLSRQRVLYTDYPRMPTLSTVLLSIKGEARKANLTLNENINLSIEILQKDFKKKESEIENDNK
jgi:hypothetical protein